ncbi:MAG TPA: M15 family metallopeptidase [Candidatus Limiplasma sp.]|nr:M15 family metallopeptidase [Candidatus Limiplasma sp.]HPR77495.1 M15 family metallopeptidase [Candidatus Limiplasma sp.]
MRKLAAVVLALAMLAGCCTAFAEDAVSADDSPLTSAEPTVSAELTALPSEAPASTPAEDNSTSAGSEWAFPVSLTELESDHAILVNRDHLLDASFVPEDLVRVSVKCVSSSKAEIRKVASDALEKMFADASLVTEYTYKVKNKAGDWTDKQFSDSRGLRFIVKSGYRSYGTQKTTYNNYLARNNGKDDGISSPPGASEHQSGLALDVLSVDYNANNQYMNDSFYQTPEAQWLADNCYSYGFILRYPEDKADITKVPYEPWHIRYVGREIAGYIKVNNLSLEEFTDLWQQKLKDFESSGGSVDAQLLLESTRRTNGLESTVTEDYGEDGDAEISLAF